MNLRPSRDRAVSEIVGVVILVTIFVTAAAFLMAHAISRPDTQNLPALNAIISNESTIVKVYHAGGDAIPGTALSLVINGVATPFFVTGGDTVWSIGETLTASAGSVPKTVSLVYTPGTGSFLLVSRNPGDEGEDTFPAATTITTVTSLPTSTVTTTIPVTSPTAAPSPVSAAFSGTPTTGSRPLTVWFTDASTGPVTSWTWTFGDGNVSSAQNPVYTYLSGGTYSVSLTVSNGSGSSTQTRTGYIMVATPAPVADFTGTPRFGAAPLTVAFTDTSSNLPKAWAWNFGDGGSSTLQNPSHQYLTAGTYTVTLTAANEGGSDSLARAAYISVSSVSFTITASALRANGNPAPAGWGTISPSGAVTVPFGADQGFTIAEGSKTLVSLVVDGVPRPVVRPTMTYTFTNVSANHVIVATFD